jgi:hypothetical protein
MLNPWVNQTRFKAITRRKSYIPFTRSRWITELHGRRLRLVVHGLRERNIGLHFDERLELEAGTYGERRRSRTGSEITTTDPPTNYAGTLHTHYSTNVHTRIYGTRLATSPPPSELSAHPLILPTSRLPASPSPYKTKDLLRFL